MKIDYHISAGREIDIYMGYPGSKEFQDDKTYVLMSYIFRMEANRESRMPIISAVDDKNQIVQVKTDMQSTDEEYYKIMADIMKIISKFDKPNLLIEYTGDINKAKQQSLKRILTFNLESVKYLNKIAIYSLYKPNDLHEISEFCMSQNTSCKNFRNIEQAKKWLKAE